VSSIRQPIGDHHKYTSDALRSARETVLNGDELRRSYPRPLGAAKVIVLITGDLVTVNSNQVDIVTAVT